jgi:hypothetical protein
LVTTFFSNFTGNGKESLQQKKVTMLSLPPVHKKTLPLIRPVLQLNVLQNQEQTALNSFTQIVPRLANGFLTSPTVRGTNSLLKVTKVLQELVFSP